MPHLIKFHFPNGSWNLRLIKPICLALQPFLHGGWRHAKELRNKPVRGFPQRVQDHRKGPFHRGLRFHAVISNHKVIAARLALIALLVSDAPIFDGLGSVTVLAMCHGILLSV
jgi:hypothetical protein